MKRTKRLLALVLAMMMAFSMLAIPAAAHGDEDEGIMPLGVERPCTRPNCFGTVSRYTCIERDTVYGVCPTCYTVHTYYKVYQCVRDACDSCSFDEVVTRTFLRNEHA